MKIALIGFGKMGKEIAEFVEESQQDTIVSISHGKKKDLDIQGMRNADVVIDFTSPEIVMDNIRIVVGLGVNMVVGTTGWYEQVNEVKKIVQKNKIGFVYGQNFSIGANIFFHINAYASRLISKFEGYDVYGFEVHHAGKKDSPSGTAKKLSDIILNNFITKKALQKDSLNRPIRKDELHFVSVRGGVNPGRHTITFDSFSDEIVLTHQAHNRQGFVSGALLAARFIYEKKGIYTFEDLIKEAIE